jgi:hypothetical protein
MSKPRADLCTLQQRARRTYYLHADRWYPDGTHTSETTERTAWPPRPERSLIMPDARYVYVGDGTEFHAFIPARDLTDDDLAALDAEQRATVKASRLYQAPPPSKVADVKADAPAKDAPKA